MNEIQVFNNKEFGEIRVIEIDDEIWFIGKDVVKALGYNLTNNRYGFYINKFVDIEDKLDCNSQSSFNFDYKILGQRGGYLESE